MSQKTIIYGELPKKGGLENLQGRWQKIGSRRVGLIHEGGSIPRCTL